MYSMEIRVGITDVDQDNRLTLPAIIGYFQNCCSLQSEDLGVGIDYLKEKDLMWVLSYWQVTVNSHAHLGDRIKVVTRPYEIKGFLGSRNFYILDSMDRMIVVANTLWSLLSASTLKPARVTDEMLQKYVLGEKLGMYYAPRKIAFPNGGQTLEPLVVQAYHLDTNHHMNNEQYIRIAQCALPDGFIPTGMRAEYKSSAVLGDTVIPKVYPAGNVYYVELSSPEGKVFSTIEFSL